MRYIHRVIANNRRLGGGILAQNQKDNKHRKLVVIKKWRSPLKWYCLLKLAAGKILESIPLSVLFMIMERSESCAARRHESVCADKKRKTNCLISNVNALSLSEREKTMRSDAL